MGSHDGAGASLFLLLDDGNVGAELVSVADHNTDDVVIGQLGAASLADPERDPEPRLPEVSLRHILGEPGDLGAGVGHADKEDFAVDGHVDAELGGVGSAAFIAEDLVGWRSGGSVAEDAAHLPKDAAHLPKTQKGEHTLNTNEHFQSIKSTVGNIMLFSENTTIIFDRTI